MSSPDLYRKEAYQSRVKGFSNPVSIRGSLSASVIMLLLLALFAGLVAYGWATPYTRKVVAAGYVAPKSGRVNITSPVGGVARVMVENGASVQKGDVLAVVVDELSDTGVESISTLTLDALRARSELLNQRLALLERRSESTSKVFETRRTNTVRQIASKERLLALEESENALTRASRDRVLRLVSEGLDTQRSLEQAETQVIFAGQNLVDAEADVLRSQETLENLEIERDIELNALEEEKLAVATERLTVQNEITRLEAERRRQIVAPLDGIVTVGPARSLERVTAGMSLFTVDPTGEDFTATIFAPSSAIGFVYPGDEVAIRYLAYPYREHGVFHGTVASVDNTAHLPAVIDAPVSGNEPVYRVYVKIEQTPVSKRGETLQLRSGMLLDASIIADEKPILFWFLEPVL